MTARRLINRVVMAVLYLAAWCLNAFAAEVAYIDTPSGQSYTRQQMETAAKFYGLEIGVTILVDHGQNAEAINTIGNTKTLAVVITADALATLSQEEIFAALKKRTRRVPLLIAGITEDTNPALLREWSAGAIAGCKKVRIKRGTDAYAIASFNHIARQLSGSRLPLNQEALPYLAFGGGSGAHCLMAATSAGVERPVFAHAVIVGQEVFFAAAEPASDIPLAGDPYREPAVFATLAPEMMFLRYAGGEQGWHSPGQFANLTIDDAWLRQPYGYINYEKLLREMEQHNFHTTLAFVPWNFDRSQPAMVSLFRAHRDRFSLCIHGNNHDHQEFGSYDSKPLTGQIDDVKQGLARMAKFSELTQLPYDPVMVFPHAISPEKTLAVLKRYNFAATANFLNVPLGATAPSDPEFALRPATIAFSNFPSLRRYSAEAAMPGSQLTIDAFLGNPMLFYVHQGFFASGIGAFNNTADTVNHLQPATKWRSLGYIAQHLYLEKLRDDGNYQIRSYAGTIQLSNSHQRDATFFVDKEENFTLPLTVLVDGQPYPYHKVGMRLCLQLPIPAGMSREITIKYRNDFDAAGVDISKTSLRISAIRHLSDFRDNVVSKTGLGRRFILSYSQAGRGWNMVMALLTGLVAIAVACWYMRKRKKSPVSREPPASGLRNCT